MKCQISYCDNQATTFATFYDMKLSYCLEHAEILKQLKVVRDGGRAGWMAKSLTGHDNEK